MLKSYSQIDFWRDLAILFSKEKDCSMDDWYENAEAIRQRVAAASTEIEVPQEVWHYLSDYDIRQKDEEYAEIQIGSIALLLNGQSHNH